ncbi:MAG: TIGR03087 family PEP-CTERM/XrtA system glycosyltransferase [Planctomycetota bacterium]|nr:TIGR03087 family PEP-CTERM/XrtA system glycosyltransferase [Planctomycetota bacterium]
MKRLLFIAHRVPFPPDKGERVRAFHEIGALSRHFQVTVAALSHNRDDVAAVAGLRELCHKVIVAPSAGAMGLIRGGISLLIGRSVTEEYFHSRRLREMIISEARREPFDLVMCYSSSTLPFGLAVSAPVRVIDLVDIDSAKWSGYSASARWPKSLLYRHEAAAVGRLERRAVERCDAALLVSEAESAAMGPVGSKVITVANGVDVDFFRPDAVAPADLGPASLVFTGTMDYRPNVEAVCWFVREVWPETKRRIPELTFTIVGRNPTRPVRRLAKIPGLNVTGSVPDVRGYLAAAGVVICPLQMARGIQNKVLEAMAMGKAVVASPAALEGLDVETGKDLLQADTPDEWRRYILELLADGELRDRLGRSARVCVESKYNWTKRMEPLVSLCLRLIRSKEEGFAR